METNNIIKAVLEATGVKMVNEEKVTRAVFGMDTSKGKVDGVGEDAGLDVILAKYDSLHGYMTKGGYKVKYGTFFDKAAYRKGQTVPTKEPKIVLLIKVNGEVVEQEEAAPAPIEVQVAMVQQKKKKSKKIEE